MERVVLNALADGMLGCRLVLFRASGGQDDPPICAVLWESEHDQARRKTIAQAAPATLQV